MSPAILSRSSALRVACALSFAACGGGTQQPAPQTGTPAAGTAVAAAKPAAPRNTPPDAGPRRDVRFPAITRAQTAKGLELDMIEMRQLPVVQISLVVRSGGATDPEKLPGLAQLTAAMLKEGTLKKSSAKLAEAVDFLGAQLHVASDEDSLVVTMSALSEHFEQALEIVAEVATKPAFSQDELDKLRKRELARLELNSQSPHFLARREFNKVLYGEHPYAHVDTTADVVKRVKRTDLQQWHKRYVVPNNAFLTVVGAVSPDAVKTSAERVFGAWQSREVAVVASKAPPARSKREVVLVDRHNSVQSVIYYGNLALPRNDPDYVALTVANQVLGGSAASRLFMDLREKRSLTYGAYSDIDERVQVGPFLSFASVRNEVTAEAMSAFNDHLRRIVSEPPSAVELAAAKRFLIDRFPLRIETPDKIAQLLVELRTYGLSDDYWDRFGPAIEGVTAEAAFAAARKHIHPEQGLIVVVGEATAVKPALDAYGPVTVVDVDGKLVVKPGPATSAGQPAPAQPAPAQPAPAQPSSAQAQPAQPAARTAPPSAAAKGAAPAAAPATPAKVP
ncbi:MAG TPA: pitrilysin family protein [Polyangiales bacterium]|nr:pitrilysin family protein [Polyangiales bacterium]